MSRLLTYNNVRKKCDSSTRMSTNDFDFIYPVSIQSADEWKHETDLYCKSNVEAINLVHSFILLFTKPNIEVSDWLYQTKTHFTHIVYQPFSRVSPPSFTLYNCNTVNLKSI